MTICIGICGLVASGKSTLAEKLCQNFRESYFNVVVMSMVDDINAIINILARIKTLRERVDYIDLTLQSYGYTNMRITAWNIAEMFEMLYITCEKPCRLIQYIGTEVGRAIDESIWVKRVQERIQQSSADIVIVDDIRYDNELYMLDYLVAIDTIHYPEAYEKNKQGYSSHYLLGGTDSCISMEPSYHIPCGFTTADVHHLAEFILQEDFVRHYQRELVP